MRHQCSSCFGEFFDDASSSSPPERVFCVFCGTELPAPKSRAVPFSADFPREDAFALGVIGGVTPGFPDTLRQFRAHGAPRELDSLAPVHDDTEEKTAASAPPPYRLSRFWASLAVGFVVGAGVAVLFAERATPQPAVVNPGSVAASRPVRPSVSLSGCATSAPASAATASAAARAEPVLESKPPVTPRLEKRFWLERARNAQREYRLEEAERFYRRALSRAPRDSEALAGLGELEMLRGQRAAASARFTEALEANADYVPARVALADLHWQSGQAEAARREYRDIVEQYSADLFPPYVTQRLEGADACVPQCDVAGASAPSPQAPLP